MSSSGRPIHRRASVVALLLGMVAAGLMLLPRDLAVSLKAGIRDAALPGQRLALALKRQAASLVQTLHEPAATNAQSPETSELRRLARQLRALRLENAMLHEQIADLERQRALPVAGSPGEALIVPELVAATVLGAESAELWRSGKLLDRGTTDGVTESALVVETFGPLIDQGADAGLQTGQPVYAGRSVVGRIAAAGRWTSTVQTVTAPEYRDLAQLVRSTSQGYVAGAQGKLEGRGEPLLRLTYVPATEPVSVGDEVYTANHDPAFRFPMYYGKVVRAELPPGALHWEIWVKPAAAFDKQQSVQVLRRSLNPARLLGH